MKKVIASIIVYNPDMERLENNIKAIVRQVSEIVIIINGLEDYVSFNALIERYYNEVPVKVIKNKDNMGIAYALNQAMKYAYSKHYEWVLTLDQDTVCPDDLVKNLMSHSGNERVGIIAPNYIDRNYFREQTEYTGWKYVMACITSASLTNVDIWRKVGGFDNKLFIDYVDYDYCAKLIYNGYAIIMDYDQKIIHEIGDGHKKYFGKYSMVIYNHSPMRKYYIFRNICIYCNRYPDICKTVINKNGYIIRNFIAVIFFEDKKIKKLTAMIRGLHDSKKIIREEKKAKRLELDKRRKYAKTQKDNTISNN